MMVAGMMLAIPGMAFAARPQTPVMRDASMQANAIATGKIQKRADDSKRMRKAAPMKETTFTSPTPEGVENEKVYSWPNENVPGTLVDGLYKSATGYEMGWFMPQSFRVSGVAGNYVLDEANSEIYIYNPITRYNSYSYIKGSIDADGNVTCRMPQLLACNQPEDADEPWAYYVMNTTLNEEGTAFIPVDGNLDIHYTLKDGVLTLNEDSKIGMFEYVQYYYWDENDEKVTVPDTYFWDMTGYCDYTQSMREFNEVAPNPGKDLATETWRVLSRGLDSYSETLLGYTATEIQACIDGNEFWVKGIDKNVPDCWFKGDIEGDKITFRKSFVCYDDVAGYFQFLLVGNQVWDASEEAYMFSQEPEMTFDFDPETRTIIGHDTQSIYVNAGDEYIYYLCRWLQPIISVPVDMAPATPLTPIFLDYWERDLEDDYSTSGFQFAVSAFDVNYTALSTDNLFYEILVDGEPYIFDEEAIGSIWGDVTVSGDVEQIPWLLDSDNIYPNGTKRTIYHTFMGYDTIGARVLYINDNDDYLYSDAIVYNVKTGEVTVVPGSGVEEIGVGSHGDIVNVAYTSLDGVRIERPEMGIVLMTVTYSDGFVKTVKVARR